MDIKKTKTFYSGGFLYNKDTKSVLLHLRDGNTEYNPGMWAFFGGQNEGEESPEETFIRELKEETGIIVDQKDLRHLCDYLNDHLHTWRYIFYAESDVTEDRIKLTEGAGFAWIPLSEVFAYNMTEKTRNDLKTFISRINSKN